MYVCVCVCVCCYMMGVLFEIDGRQSEFVCMYVCMYVCVCVYVCMCVLLCDGGAV